MDLPFFRFNDALGAYLGTLVSYVCGFIGVFILQVGMESFEMDPCHCYNHWRIGSSK
jgi:hypothetical protein